MILPTRLGIFEILKIEILMIVFFLFLNIGPYGSQNVKTLPLPQIAVESFQTFFWIFFLVVVTKVLFSIFEMLSFRFLTICLALLRAHEIEICPSSVVRPPVSQLSLNIMQEFLSNFSCGLPWAIRSYIFRFKKKNSLFFTNIFRFR